jgi:hypothetical protein
MLPMDEYGGLEAARWATFRDARDAQAWLDEALPALQGQTPRQLIRAGHAERVAALLHAINAGG